MKQLKLAGLILSSALICIGCTNYDRPQSANLGICKKIRLEMNTANAYHNPNATHSTHPSQVSLMSQYKHYDCENRPSNM